MSKQMKFYIEALKYTVLTGATFHLSLLLIYALQTRDIQVLNMFNVLDLELFVPNLIDSWQMLLLSYLVIGAIWLFMLKKVKK